MTATNVATKETIYLEYALPVQIKRPENLHLVSFFPSQKQVGIEKTIICCFDFIPYYTYAEILKVKTQQEKVSALYIYIYLFI